MIKNVLEKSMEIFEKRALPGGGFSGLSNGNYRPDATAWATVILSAMDGPIDMIMRARSRLVKNQMEDGRVCINPEHPQTSWVTPLAVISWYGSREHSKMQSSAVEFLLNSSGLHWKKNKNSIVGHDTSIKGWPWIENTHSWVEPTAMALMALEIIGEKNNQRSQEGRKMLLDRQLSLGGWNYGNTTVFDRPIRPMVESTGLALCSLSGHVKQKAVERSLVYLKNQVDQLNTPLTLGWGLLGLGAWNGLPDTAEQLVCRCFERQKIYGAYDTSQLSLLLIALLAKKGFVRLILDK